MLFLWQDLPSSWNWEKRKGKTGLGIFRFPLEIRDVSSGVFPAFVFKEKIVQYVLVYQVKKSLLMI